jgi:ATP-dependent Zn protease
MALNALLTEMDGFSFDLKRPVFVLAATNFEVDESKGGKGALDPALVRRFDRSILVDLPNKDDRKQYIERFFSRNDKHSVSHELIERLAVRSAGLSLAALESIMELAARNAVKKNELLSDDLLEDAFETFRHGAEKDWGDEYLERVARHEAGHAYISWLAGNTPSYTTIVARDSHGGYMEYADTRDTPIKTKEELLSSIRTSLGGRASELVYYGDEDGLSTGASGDLKNATNRAKSMLIRYGMDKEFGLAVISEDEAKNEPLAMEIKRKVDSILFQQLDLAVSMLSEDKDKLDKLVTALLEKNKLTAEEVDALLCEKTSDK